MIFPENLDEDPEARREFREEWFEREEAEEIAEDEVSISDTGDGRSPIVDDELEDEEELEDELDEGMHVGNIEDEGGSDDPVDHYLESDSDDETRPHRAINLDDAD